MTESVVEEATFDWFAELGYETLHGPEIAPDEPNAEQQSYELTSSRYGKMTSDLQQSSTLAAIGSALLPGLVSGQMRMSKAMEQRKRGA